MKLHDSFFEQRRNSAAELGHSTFQKLNSTLRTMAYGISDDLIDDNLVMSESQAIKCGKRFSIDLVEVFHMDYFRAPNAQDMAKILAINAACGFPSMLGSINCIHRRWKIHPAAWHRQFKGH
jgi:hypothetical protein